MERLVFSTEDSEKIDKYKAGLDLNSPDSVSIFGTALQQKMAGLSSRLLKNTVKQNVTKANELMEKINSFAKETECKKGISLFKKKSKPVSLSDLDIIENDLKLSQAKFLKDIALYQKFNDENEENIHELELLICAGEEKKSEEPSALCIEQFEKKLYDMKTTHTVALQTREQLKIMTRSEAETADKIRSIVVNTIPILRMHQNLTA